MTSGTEARMEPLNLTSSLRSPIFAGHLQMKYSQEVQEHRSEWYRIAAPPGLMCAIWGGSWQNLAWGVPEGGHSVFVTDSAATQLSSV